jgi:hypothetical protein
MVIVLAVVALTLVAIAAVRFGRDNRSALTSTQHELAVLGVTWDELETDPGDRVSVARRPYPILALIEQALGGHPGALTSAPNAATLENRTRAFVAEFWSDVAWTTGIVPAQAFERVVAELAPYLFAVPTPIADFQMLAGREHAPVDSAA